MDAYESGYEVRLEMLELNARTKSKSCLELQ